MRRVRASRAGPRARPRSKGYSAVPHLNPNFLRFAIILIADSALAAAFYPALRWRSSRRVALLVPLILIIAASPLLMPSRARVLRFLQTLFATGILVKLYDAGAQPVGAPAPSFWEYLKYLPNDLWAVLRRPPPEAAWPARKNLRLLALRSAGLAIGLLLCFAAWNINWTATPFLAENAAK